MCVSIFTFREDIYMKHYFTPLKRILAFVLMLATTCSVFSACTALDDMEDASDTNFYSDIYVGTNNGFLETNGATDDFEDTDIPISDGIIVFSNGQYLTKLICSDKATDLEKNIYNQIKELLRKKTGVNPDTTTDFVAAGTEKYDGPAILIGETNYAESKAAYKNLANEQATATLSGNKYVIAFSSEDAFAKLLISFKNNLSKKASKNEI